MNTERQIYELRVEYEKRVALWKAIVALIIGPLAMPLSDIVERALPVWLGFQIAGAIWLFYEGHKINRLIGNPPTDGPDGGSRKRLPLVRLLPTSRRALPAPDKYLRAA